MKEKDITLCFLTCKRLFLFTKTLSTFFKCCLDSFLISNIILVDDNSCKEDIEEMRSLLRLTQIPFLLIAKDKDSKGHLKSLNYIYDNVKTKYIIMCEEDWEFNQADIFLTKAFEIMDENPEIKQVLFRTGDIMAVDQDIKTTRKSNIKHIKYNFPGQFARDSKNRPAWPGCNLNPALWNFEYFKKSGKFPENEPNFEFNWSRRMWKAGCKIAYFPMNYCEHIGVGDNAYKLNNTRK